MRYLRARHHIACLGLVALLSVVTLGICASVAAAKGVTVELIPKVLPPSGGESMPLDVIVRNHGPAVTNVTLSFMKYSPGFHWELHLAPGTARSLTIARLARGEEADWRIRSATPALYTSGKAYCIVRYVAAGKARIVTTSLDVQGVSRSELEDVATVDIKTTLDWLDDKTQGVVYLLVTNRSARPIRIMRVDPDGPPFVEFEDAKPASTRGQAETPMLLKEIDIRPRETQAVAVAVKSPDGVRPGKYLLLFNVLLKWHEGSRPQLATVIASQETKIGVYAENEILKALNVPLLLFLPGVVIMAALGWFGSRPTSKPKKIQFENPDRHLVTRGRPVAVLADRLHRPASRVVGLRGRVLQLRWSVACGSLSRSDRCDLSWVYRRRLDSAQADAANAEVGAGHGCESPPSECPDVYPRARVLRSWGRSSEERTLQVRCYSPTNRRWTGGGRALTSAVPTQQR